MSLLPKGLPGTSFARYLEQEKKKFIEKHGVQNYTGIFQDIEKAGLGLTEQQKFEILKDQKTEAVKPRITKAAPGSGKRKVILEDE